MLKFQPYNVNPPLSSFTDWNYLRISVPGFIEPFYSNIYSQEICAGINLSIGRALPMITFVQAGVSHYQNIGVMEISLMSITHHPNLTLSFSQVLN